MGLDRIPVWLQRVVLFMVLGLAPGFQTTAYALGASCSITPSGPVGAAVLEKGAAFSINLSFVNDKTRAVVFTAKMKANLFFGPEHTLGIRSVGAGLGQTMHLTVSTQDVLQTGTAPIVIEITSDATGSDVLSSCTTYLTVSLPREITIPMSQFVPVLDGACGTAEYNDAGIVALSPAAGSPSATLFAKHTDSDLYLCLKSPIAPASGNATVRISRAGQGGAQPGPDDMVFTIPYQGAQSAYARRGGSQGFNGPDTGGWEVKTATAASGWSAEMRISRATLGDGLWDRDLGLAYTLADSTNIWPKASQPDVPQTWGVAHLTGAPGVWLTDFHGVAIEVTQAIQDLDNTVMLVAGKRTFVRFHVTSTRAAVLPLYAGARLQGLRPDGSSLGTPLVPVNLNAVQFTTPHDRGRIDDSYLFELPADWIRPGAITLKATVNPFHAVGEADYANNTIGTGLINFQERQPLRVKIIDYQFKYEGAVRSLGNRADELESKLLRTLPIAELSSTRITWLDEQATPFDRFAARDRLLWWGETMDNAKDQPGVYYYALMETQGGVTYTNSRLAVGISGDTALHEFGHMFGLQHIQTTGTSACNAPDAPFEQYPYPDGIIGGPAGDAARFYGFDAGDPSLKVGALENGAPMSVVPNTVHDMMTYCTARWFSDYDYARIAKALQTPSASWYSLPASGTKQPISGNFLAVYGSFIPASESVILHVLRRQNQVTRIPERTAGPYHLRLLNARNQLLADYAFTPSAMADASAPYQIRLVVPFVAGTRRIVIYTERSRRELVSVPVSAHAPAVSNLSRTGQNPIVLTWQGSDADGDALFSDVMYSPNAGQTWRPLITGIGTTTATIDPAQLEGSSTAMFRVIVTDGVHTAVAQTNAFTVPAKAPLVRIVSPGMGECYLYGQTVALHGMARDLEDGTLTGASLRWISDRDGFLGTGALIHQRLLSQGKHTISLEATDSSGLTARTGVSITVVTENAPDTLPPVLNCQAGDGVWHSGDASVPCTAGDRQSGLAEPENRSFSIATMVPLGMETNAAVTNSRTVCDKAGNCSLAGPAADLKVDKKPPAVRVESPEAGSIYPSGQKIFVKYQCADAGSGLSSCAASQPIGAPLDATATGCHDLRITATDKVGNTVDIRSSYEIIDLPSSIVPEDCIPYDPANLRIVDQGSSGWLLTDGAMRMLMLDNESDARDALAMAQCHASQCFIGRGNTRTNRKDYIVAYWKGGSGQTPAIKKRDCIPYDPNNLRVVSLGSDGWLLTDGTSRLLILDNRPDAINALILAKRHSRLCFIGRGNTRPNRKDYIVCYWE